MTRIYRSLAVVVAFALGCAARPDPRQVARFEDLSHSYIEGSYAFNPSFATYWGFHKFDDSLENWTPEAIGAEEARIRGALKDLEAIDPKKLDPATRIDFELFHRSAEGHLFNLVEMRPWETDPGQYNYGFMLESMIARGYAPPEERLRSLTSRLRRVGRQLANARVNLKNPPKMFTEFAIGDFGGTISYLQNDVARAFASVKDPALKGDFDKAKAEAVAETERHVKW